MEYYLFIKKLTNIVIDIRIKAAIDYLGYKNAFGSIQLLLYIQSLMVIEII